MDRASRFEAFVDSGSRILARVTLILGIIAICYIVIPAVVMICKAPSYAPRPRPHTIEESSTIKNRRDGRVTYITTDSRIYFVRDGREITVIRRGA